MDNQIPKTEFYVTFCDALPLVVMPKRFTVLEAVTFKEKGNQILAESSLPKSILLDFNLTEFIDSSGIGALVYLHKAAALKNVELSLLNIKAPVRAVLSMTQLDQVFKIIELNSNKSTSSGNNLSQVPETHPSVKSVIKRLLDIVGSLVGLVITGILFIPIAILIKKDSPGPIFSIKNAVAGWAKGFRLLNLGQCVMMQKLLKQKYPMK